MKTARGGGDRDGKGVRVVSRADEVRDWFTALAEDGRGGHLLAEQLVSASCGSSAAGRGCAPAARPRPGRSSRPFERDGVCAEVLAPAPVTHPETLDEAARIGRAVA